MCIFISPHEHIEISYSRNSIRTYTFAFANYSGTSIPHFIVFQTHSLVSLPFFPNPLAARPLAFAHFVQHKIPSVKFFR